MEIAVCWEGSDVLETVTVREERQGRGPSSPSSVDPLILESRGQCAGCPDFVELSGSVLILWECLRQGHDNGKQGPGSKSKERVLGAPASRARWEGGGSKS